MIARVAAVGLLAAGLTGCVTGHLFDAARRREHPLEIMAAARDGDHVLVRYRAEVTGDMGAPHGIVERGAGLPLAVLRAPTTPNADAVSPIWVTPTRVAHATPLPLARDVPLVGPALGVLRADGRDAALVWHDGAAAGAPIPTSALTRLRTAPWVWPLVPAALAADAVVVPVLVLFSPSMLVTGE